MHQADSAPCRNTKYATKLPALLLLFAGLVLSTAGLAENPAGVVKFARGDVTIETGTGDSREAEKDGELMQGELVVTGVDSLAVILLNDESRLVIRPDSEFRVSRLVTSDDDEGDSSNQSAVLNLLRGGVRLVTGLIARLNPAGYRLNTPVATIGIRGTEFNTRLCDADCAAEESELRGDDAAGAIEQGLYVNVDDGEVFLLNFGVVEPLDLSVGESGYVADLNTAPVTLDAVPAFLALDRIPSPSALDFDDIEIPDIDLEVGAGDAAAAAAGAVTAAAAAAAAVIPASEEEAAVIPASEEEAAVIPAGAEEAAVLDVTGTYEIDDIDYSSTLPIADRRLFFGSSPDIEFALRQDGNEIRGDFDGDREGEIFAGKIDGNVIEIEFTLEARGGELKDGTATLTVDDDGNLSGEFRIRDRARGIVRGMWTLEKAGVEAAAVAATSEAAAAIRDIAGTYEIDDIDYSSTLPIADRRLFFGSSPDIEFILTQQADNIRGEFDGDREGEIFAGKIDGNVVEIEFTLEARGGELKDGAATLTVDDDGNLSGDFWIRDPAKGVIRGLWTLEKTD